MDIYHLLQECRIPYEKASHPPVFTAEEAEKYKTLMPFGALGSKTLFLTDSRRENYLLAFMEDSQRADLKRIARDAGTGRLHFAGPEALQQILKLTPGSVTPLILLVYQPAVPVKIWLDPSLKGQKVLMHPPFTNAESLSLRFEDLRDLLRQKGRQSVLISPD